MSSVKKIFVGRHCLLVLLILFISTECFAQLPRRRPTSPINQGNLPNLGNLGDIGKGGKKDTIGFEHRNDLADSITISFRYFDSLTSQHLDTTIDDFGHFYPLPAGYVTIGGTGNAAFPVLFEPNTNPGWDPGFHSFDIYRYTLANTRFFQTTRPFTSLNYYQSTGKEQVIKVLHTQNIKPNWNAAVEYRLISNPGIFQNQNVKHKNYRFSTSYQGRRKRYAATLVIFGNDLVSAENGGITDPALLADPNRKRRIAIPVNLGNNSTSSLALFSSKISAGNRYSDMEFLLRQSYDLGKKDSLKINDSTMEYLFYPKLRIQHTINYIKSSFQFVDELPDFETGRGDSAFFSDFYNLKIRPNASNLFFRDEWKYISNDFSLKQFPDTKNQKQFLEAGIRLENYKGWFTRVDIPTTIITIYPKPPTILSYFNAVLHGNYRNKTRNQKWDAALNGELYVAGFFAGEFHLSASLQRFLNKRWGAIEVFGSNTSRSPSAIFQANSAFNFDSTSLKKKENITVLGITAVNPKFKLSVRNISIANYAYLTNYYEKDQFSGLINLTQGTLSSKNKIVGHLNLYSDFIVQQTTGKTPVHVPLFYTRQRVAFEGNFFKNLNLSTGLEVIYNTPYKANHYSPVLGRFFPQDSISISNRPVINAFFNFRIKSFTAFIKAENLNTAAINDGLAFTNNNLSAPYYPTPGLMIRFGIKWGMVN